CSSFAGTNVLV
nr:immunoglobulin light chain junction region [Macaca mulatta]